MTALYRVLEPLRHDGVDYAPDGVVTLGPATATALVVAGVVTTLPPASASEGQGEGEAPAAPLRPTSGKGAAGRRVAPTPA